MFLPNLPGPDKKGPGFFISRLQILGGAIKLHESFERVSAPLAGPSARSNAYGPGSGIEISVRGASSALLCLCCEAIAGLAIRIIEPTIRVVSVLGSHHCWRE